MSRVRPTNWAQNIDGLNATIEAMRSAARIPGAAIAVVENGQTIFAKGYGYRDLVAQLPATSDTVYPIASTTKAFNATLLGMLVDDGRLAWDTPVQNYLPRFRLADPFTSAQVTIRDLVIMRTGLPRHDWLWVEHAINRPELAERLRYLDSSAGFRERFQYCNLTAAVAGHIAEIVTGRSWEELVQERILEPLHMNCTGFANPKTGPVTVSYHENARRELKLCQRRAGEVIAPAGGAIHSTVEDMARWVLFNLRGGVAGDRPLINEQTLAEIQSPQIAVGADPTGPTPNAAYAMGWFADTYNGFLRVSHGGYLHDVSSDVMLFPKESIGMVSFTNFGPPIPARLINEHAFDSLMGCDPAESLEKKLLQYENKIAETRQRNAAVRRVEGNQPSHSLEQYMGLYENPGYGPIEIQRDGEELILQRGQLVLPLQHWHYDAWIAKDCEVFRIDAPHAFDRASRIIFDTSADGDIAGLSIRLEPAVSPIRFIKQQAHS